MISHNLGLQLLFFQTGCAIQVRHAGNTAVLGGPTYSLGIYVHSKKEISVFEWGSGGLKK